MSAGPMTLGIRELLEFGLACARGESPPARAPVRLLVQGSGQWRDFQSWPPDGYPPRCFRLQPGGALSPQDPAESAPDTYRYDPADPTPAVGGSRFGARGPARVRRGDHVGFAFGPEAEDRTRELRDFTSRHWGRPASAG
jgi:predicted acyl esterase